MANIADFIEVNTDENFAKWASMIVCPEKFQVELQPDLKTVIIQEKDSQLATVRVEMSMFPFPYFYQWRNNKKCSYNVALLTVLNKMLQQSSYLNEISDGLKRITNHRCFSLASNENGYNKDLHTFIMVDSEFVSDFDISNPDVREFASKLHMQPNSEKAVGDGSLVISSNPIYNAVGYHFENGNYTSIFPNKSNLPARLKSFILPNSVKLDFPSNNVFIGGDENTMECLVVFVRPGKERHVSGEIWIEKSRFRNITFTQQKRVWYTETNIKTGDVLHPKDAVIKSPFGDDTSLNNAVSIECTERNPFYMRMNVSYSLNEARITSNTGLKGYSSVQDNIGTLAVQTLDEGYQQLKPDMVCGPSSLKGKVNQIRLAQAAFVARFIHDYEPGTLDSLNEELINQLADECPVGIWVDADGCEHECYYGLVHVAFTDPSVQYSKNSYMGFQFEMLKLAMIEYPKLANILMDSRNKDDLDVVKEIVYLEQSGIFQIHFRQV